MVWKPSWWSDLAAQMWAYIKNTPGPPHLGHNALGGFTYTMFVILVGLFQLLTGFGLYSETHPGGFWDHVCGWVLPLLGGPMTTRTLHHLAAWAFAVFFIMHIYIVFYDGVNYRSGLISSMISGYKYYKDGDEDHVSWIS
jgi:Ni/Fe-hydrogenase 1 B-type cytochrome subunit